MDASPATQPASPPMETCEHRLSCCTSTFITGFDRPMRMDLATAAETVTVSGKPTIDGPSDRVDARHAKQHTERPQPPDVAHQRGPGIDAADDTAIRQFQPHLFEQLRFRDAQPRRRAGHLQRQPDEATASEQSAPALHASDAEAALGVVKHPALLAVIYWHFGIHR